MATPGLFFFSWFEIQVVHVDCSVRSAVELQIYDNIAICIRCKVILSTRKMYLEGGKFCV